MVSGTSRTFAAKIFVVGIALQTAALSCAPGACAQSKTAGPTVLHASRRSAVDCAEYSPARPADLELRLIALDPSIRCADSASYDVPSLHKTSPASKAAVDLPQPANDPVIEELSELGKRGREISETRNAVAAILEDGSACSAWFLSKNSDGVRVFLSLHMALDEHGSGFVQKTVLSTSEHIYAHPYVARAQQNVGPGSVITINRHGAFFEDAGGVMDVKKEGGPARFEPPRPLKVGSYRGATLSARVLTILHEFGHIIDLLPLDAGVPGGPEISMKNSRLVEEHCKAQIEAASRKPEQAGAFSASLPSPRP